MPGIQHKNLAEWFAPCPGTNEQCDLGQLKKLLTAHGVNGRGWRLYLDFGDALFSRLGKPWISDDAPFTNGRNAVAWLRLLQACEMDVPPPPGLVESLACWEFPAQRLDALPPLFFRAAWKGAIAAEYEGRSMRCFVDEEVVPVCRWFHAVGNAVKAETGLLKAGWPALLARTKEWEDHRRSVYGVPLPRIPDSVEADEWDPYVRHVDYGRYRFVALTTARQLAEEGNAMSHCVGDYAEDCANNTTRIYSVRDRKGGPRIATMSLECIAIDEEAFLWAHDQVKGFRNSEVAPDIVLAADAVLRSYTDLPYACFAHPKLPT